MKRTSLIFVTLMFVIGCSKKNVVVNTIPHETWVEKETVKPPDPVIQILPPVENKVDPKPLEDVIFFDFDSYKLRSEFIRQLDDIVLDARRGLYKALILEGYASPEGTEEYNLALSRNRADEVKSYLAQNCKIPIHTKSFGETNQWGKAPFEYHLNRRVIIRGE